MISEFNFRRTYKLMLDQELLQKLVIEVRAKNGMTPNRLNRAIERLAETGVMSNISQS